MKCQLNKKRFSFNLGFTSLIVVLFFTSFLVHAQTSKISKVVINTQSNGIFKNPDGFVEYLPPNYESRNDWPVLIWHHGLGKGGSGSSNDLQKLLDHAIMNWLKTHDVPFVVLSPQDANGYFGAGRMELFYKWAKGAYQGKTNTNAYHISVLSASGAGLANFIEANSQFAKEVATVTINGALTGTGNNTIYTNVVNNQTKIWFHHGELDYTVKHGATLNFYRGLVNKAGGSDFSKFRYTLYAGMGHSAWNEVYDNSGINRTKVTGNIDGGNYGNYYNWTSGSWYDWMLQNTKGNNPINPTPPVANAGEDKTLTLPTSSMILGGQVTSGSSTVETYLWQKIAGPNSCQLNNASTKTATISNLVEGAYRFRFTATAQGGLSDSDEVEVMVYSEPIITAPTTLGLDNTTLDENNVAGYTVGKLSSNGSAPQTYTLVSGSGAADNLYFSVSGTDLNINVSTDFETKSSYNVRLRAANDAGATEQTFSILINNVQEGTTFGRIARLNFGRNNSEPVANWNNIFENNPTVGMAPISLKEENGQPTSWKLRILDSFLSTPDVIGPTLGDDSGKYPDNVLEYAWMDRYGAEIEIYGLDNSKLYSFNIFGNSENSQSLMQCFVNDEQAGETLNVMNNAIGDQKEFTVNNVSPINGGIRIKINGDNSDGRNFGFLAALTISENSNSSMRTSPESTTSLMEMEENALINNVIVSPNPSITGIFKISGIDINEGYDYQINNMQGELIQQGKIGGEIILDAIPGIYILGVPSLNQQIRIIKK